MCGVAGVVRLGETGSVRREELSRMASTLKHRGPDGAGFVLLENGQVGLAHTRLSILDFEQGTQPMGSRTGTDEFWVTFNGELYDLEELRRQLQAAGHHFQTRSDTELLLVAYRNWGEAFLKHVHGEFAFALWDSREKKLFAARDPAGVKPFYFHFNSVKKELYFASESKAILCLPGVERKLNSAYLCGPFLGVYPPSASPFSGLESLPPGGWLRFDRQGLSTGRYWVPSYKEPSTESQRLNGEEAREGFRLALERAVRRRKVADVPVHVYLSGGVDSTSIAALMRSQSQGAMIRAYTIGFSDPSMDETSSAARIARALNLEIQTLRFTSADLVEGFEKAIWHTEHPIANPNSMAKLSLSRLVRSQGVKVCLTGEGADELLGGYPYFKQEAIFRLWNQGGENAVRAKKLWKRFCAMEQRSRGILWTPKYTRHWQSRSSQTPQGSYFSYRAALADRGYLSILNQENSEIRQQPSPQELFHQHYLTSELEDLDPFQFSRKVAFYQLTGYLIPNLGDRVEMAHSVECRTPFLDRQLMEFVNQLPSEHFLDLEQLREKRLLHESMRGLLPDFMASVHKHPFLAPGWSDFAVTVRGREILESLLSAQALKEQSWLNSRLISRLKGLWPLLPRRSFLRSQVDLVMGATLSLQMLNRLFVLQRPESDPQFALAESVVLPQEG